MNRESLSVWRGAEALAGIVGVFTTLLLLDSIGDVNGWYELLEDYDTAESFGHLLALEGGIAGAMLIAEAMHQNTRN